MVKPNLFNFATSELSQDAFLCWILSWGAPEAQSVDKELHDIARKLFQAFFSKHGKKLPPKIEKLEIRRLYRDIDIRIALPEKY